MSISRVLLVDDSASSLEVMTFFFELEGYEVSTAKNGEVAVAQAVEFKPDLILMDLQMPIKNGFDAAREIRSLPGNGDVTIVALSGRDLESEMEKINAAGFDSALPKPVSPDELRVMLDEC